MDVLTRPLVEMIPSGGIVLPAYQGQTDFRRVTISPCSADVPAKLRVVMNVARRLRGFQH
jgi:hypothetical protein